MILGWLATCSEANLLTLGCGEKVHYLLQGAKQDVQDFQNTQTPHWFQLSIFKSQVREEHPRLCDQLVHNSLIG